MKILHVGNMVNLGYLIVNHLRTERIKEELLMEKTPHSIFFKIKFYVLQNLN